MSQRYRTLFFLLFPLLVIWLESWLTVDRDWSATAMCLRLTPIAVAVFAEFLKENFRAFFVRALAYCAAIGFLAPLALNWRWEVAMESFGLYSALASWMLLQTEEFVGDSHLEKSFHLGVISVCAFLFALYLSVQLGIWGGLYADFDMARTIFYTVAVLLPLVFAGLHVSKIPHSPKQTILYAITVSLVACLYFISWRLHRFNGPRLSMAVWIYISLAVIHGGLAVAILKPVSQELWDNFAVRLISRIFSTGAIVMIAILFVVAYHIERDYAPKDRAKGAFEVEAAHLQNVGEARALSSAKAPAKEDTQEIRILNFNAWLVEGWIPQFIATPSRDNATRADLIPAAVAKYDADIIIFQEIWSHTRRLEIAAKLYKHGYRFSLEGSDSFMNYLGVGNGLLIVSRMPLDEKVEYMTFSQATRIDEGSIFASKGVIKTRVNLAASYGGEKWLDIYASHLGGFGTVLKNGVADSFIASEQAAKLQQAIELANFIKRTKTTDNFILAVDLNTHPYVFSSGKYTSEMSPEYRTLASVGLHDPVTQLYPEEEAGAFTYDTGNNYYAHSGHFAYEPSGRIDYIFSAGHALKPVSSERVLTDFALSDHFGIITTFEVR